MATRPCSLESLSCLVAANAYMTAVSIGSSTRSLFVATDSSSVIDCFPTPRCTATFFPAQNPNLPLHLKNTNLSLSYIYINELAVNKRMTAVQMLKRKSLGFPLNRAHNSTKNKWISTALSRAKKTAVIIIHDTASSRRKSKIWETCKKVLIFYISEIHHVSSDSYEKWFGCSIRQGFVLPFERPLIQILLQLLYLQSAAKIVNQFPPNCKQQLLNGVFGSHLSTRPLFTKRKHYKYSSDLLLMWDFSNNLAWMLLWFLFTLLPE